MQDHRDSAFLGRKRKRIQPQREGGKYVKPAPPSWRELRLYAFGIHNKKRRIYKGKEYFH